MKPHFACLFAILLSTMMLAQSNPVPLLKQPLVPRYLSQTPQGTPLAQRVTGAFKATASRRGALPMQGLNFAPAMPYSSGDQFAYWVAVADVNGDGKPDVVVVNQCASGSSCEANGTVGVLLGNGDGTFQTAVTYDSGGHGAVSVAVADVNADGKLDLLVANGCGSGDVNCANDTQGNVGVLLGNGDGTFQTAATYGSGGYQAFSVAVADVNGDGKPDMVVSNNCGAYKPGSDCSSGGLGTVGVLLGNGGGTFQPAVTYGSGGYRPNSVALADVNGDGKADLVVVNSCVNSNCGTATNGSVGVLLGNGDGTFQTVATYGSGGVGAVSVAVADVNGDGKPDLVVSNDCGSSGCGSGGLLAVSLGNGDGTFKSVVTYGSGGGGGTQSVTVADVNGDGKADLIATNFCGFGGGECEGNLGVLLGNGDGTFQTSVTYDSGGYGALSVVSADVNGDGKPDLLAANLCESGGNCNNGVVSALINITLTPTTTTLVSSPNPSNYGQAVAFTATIRPQVWKGTPTGTVSFFDSTTNIGNSNLNSSGVAVLTTSTLAVGTHTITATYNGDSSFAPNTSPPLYQVVQGAIAVLSPNGLNFGNQTVGIRSTRQNVMLTNTGNVNLSISQIQIVGENMSDFSQKNNCPAPLPPNSSCIIAVTFKPTNIGTRNAAVSITDNAPGSPQSIPLTGVGVLPAVTFSPTSLTFPTQIVFTTSPAQQATLTNTGLGILKISGGGISGQFGGSATCGKTVAPGASCTINVVFKPRTKGPLSGAITAKDNAPDSPQTVPLSGTGTFVQLSPKSVGFGNQPVSTTSNPKYVTLTNKGSTPVNFTGITVTGTDAGDFAEINNCDSSLVSGASCKIKVTFTPLAKGKRTADVSISDDGGGSPQMVPLTGTGTP